MISIIYGCSDHMRNYPWIPDSLEKKVKTPQSGTCLSHQVGKKVGDDTSIWRCIVLEAHSREQINKETVATLPESCIFLDRCSGEIQNVN